MGTRNADSVVGPRASMRRVTNLARRLTTTASLLAALAFGVYTNGYLQQATDSVPSSLVAATLLTDGSFCLDRFADALREVWGAEPYFLSETRRGLMSIYPPATGLLATPVSALALLTPSRWRGRSPSPSGR